jgi:phage-related protein
MPNTGIMSMEKSDDAKPRGPKPIFWMASSRKDLRRFPRGVRQTIGQSLFDAQTGGKHPGAKPLKGFGGAGVLKVVEDDDGNTYRAVYTVKFAGAVYVLHAFQKSRKPAARPRPNKSIR